MAGGGELSAAFKALAEDAAQAGENIGKSMSKFFEDTAEKEDASVATHMAAEDANTQAANAIQPKTGDLGSLESESGGPGDGSGSESARRLNEMLNGTGDADATALTDADRAALHDYTTNDGYMTMNPFLRNPDGYSDADKAAIQARADRVSTGLAKLPPRPGQTFRGVDLPDDIVAKYQPGSVVTEKAFTSTSTDPSVATGNFDGNTLMVMTGQSGRDVAPFSQYPHEAEILYDKGTKFLVTGNSFDSVTGKTVIRMKEVG